MSEQSTTTIGLSLSVYPDDQAGVLRTHEVLSRAAVGLALEGLSVAVYAHPISDEDDDG